MYVSYEDAEEKMKELIDKANFCKENLVPDKGESLHKCNMASLAIKKYGEYLAGHPLFFDIMKHWMVDVKGKGAGTGEDIEEGLESLDFFEMTEKIGGGLAKSIRGVIEENGFKITDAGGCVESWHLGVPCNEIDSRRLCTLIYMKFGKAIKAGLILVERKFWGWKLPTVRGPICGNHSSKGTD